MYLCKHAKKVLFLLYYLKCLRKLLYVNELRKKRVGGLP
jgi:hypothetical protein